MKRNKKQPYWGMEATTTSKDWGFIPVPGKGGKTTNVNLEEKNVKKEEKEA